MVEALREELGLNRPVVVQYLDWMYHAFQGEFGDSRRSGDSVAALVSDRLEVTIQLGILSLIVAVVIALPVGLLAGSRPNTPFDYFGTVFAVVGAAIPNFWLALVLILVFAVDFGWFPALGFTSFREDPLENMRGMLLPAVAIGIAQAAVLARQTRASMVESAATGLRSHGPQQGATRVDGRVPTRLPQRNDPVITILGLQISNIVSGAIIIESVFSLPGIGKLLIDSIFNRELVTVQALAMMLAVAVALSNLLVDVSYAYIDPRIRYE